MKLAERTAAAGRPPDLTLEEACAFEVAHTLMDGGVLPARRTGPLETW